MARALRVRRMVEGIGDKAQLVYFDIDFNLASMWWLRPARGQAGEKGWVMGCSKGLEAGG